MNKYSGDDLFKTYNYFVIREFKYDGIKDLVKKDVLKVFEREYEEDSRIREIRLFKKYKDNYIEITNFYNNLPFFGKEKSIETVKSFIDKVDLTIDYEYKIMIYLIEDWFTL